MADETKIRVAELEAELKYEQAENKRLRKLLRSQDKLHSRQCKSKPAVKAKPAKVHATVRCCCNRCNKEHKGGYCPACGCPEYRLLDKGQLTKKGW